MENSNSILEKIREISEAWIRVDERIGFSRIIKYVALVLLILLLINFKTVTREAVVFVQEISEQIHNDKMVKRDNLMEDLTPVLQEYRTEVKADRLLYLEYHNSKENLVGIPFKYIDLVQQNTKYGIPIASVDKYRDINVGLINTLYNDLKTKGYVICDGIDDLDFLQRCPGTFELFNEIDGSEKLIFISIPGVKQPIGMIVLEWVEGSADKTVTEMENIIKNNDYYIAIINGLILSNK